MSFGQGKLDSKKQKEYKDTVHIIIYHYEGEKH